MDKKNEKDGTVKVPCTIKVTKDKEPFNELLMLMELVHDGECLPEQHNDSLRDAQAAIVIGAYSRAAQLTVRAAVESIGILAFTKELNRVFLYGRKKYGEGTWKDVDKNLILQAMVRHINKAASGEVVNIEDGSLLHIVQAAWNGLVYLMKEKKR